MTGIHFSDYNEISIACNKLCCAFMESSSILPPEKDAHDKPLAPE